MRHTLILVLFLLLSSCNETKVLDYGIPEEMNAPTYRISLNKDQSGIRYSDFFSTVEFIPLETSEQSLIGRISKLEIADNGDLIVLDASLSSVIRFDKNGKYICHIGRCGHGHGEYIMAKDIAYDKYHNWIIVYDMSSCKLNSYDMNGKLQSSTHLDFMPAALTVLDEEHLCLYMNHNDDLSKDPIGHNLKIINREGCIMSEFMEYDATTGLFQTSCENVFFQMDSKICFKQPFSSLIYSIENASFGTQTITPEMYLDFGEYKIPEEWYRLDYSEMKAKLSEIDGDLYLISAYKVGNRLLLNVAENDRICLYIMNYQDRTQDRHSFNTRNDMYGFESNVVLKQVKDNKCYFAISSSAFDFQKERIAQEGAKFYTVDENFKPIEYIPTQKDRDLLDAIHEGDNPIIQVCTLKD